MQVMGIQFEKLDENERKIIEGDLFDSIVAKFRRDRIEENYYKYEVEIQTIKFVTEMEDGELRDSVRLTIELLEELKNINNDGLHKEQFENLLAESKNQENQPLWPLWLWNQICTDEMCHILQKLDDVRRVGGAWALLIANPQLMTAVLAVYQRIVDNFSDTGLYETCAWFLLRSVLRMHSDPVNSDVSITHE